MHARSADGVCLGPAAFTRLFQKLFARMTVRTCLQDQAAIADELLQQCSYHLVVEIRYEMQHPISEAGRERERGTMQCLLKVNVRMASSRCLRQCM